MQNVGVKPKQEIFGPAKLFLALTDGKDSRERTLIGLSICCFNQALYEHYNGNVSTQDLIVGDFCYAQGIHIAGLSMNTGIVTILSRAIADISSKSENGFSSMEETAAYLAGYLLEKEALEGYRDLGKSVKRKDIKTIGKLLDTLGFNKNLVNDIAT